MAFVADPACSQQRLAEAVARCFDDDHAEAIIVVGGPLGKVATALAQSFGQPVIAPVPSAIRRLVAALGNRLA